MSRSPRVTVDDDLEAFTASERMTLEQELKFWTDLHHKRADEIGFFAFGVATGLKMAKVSQESTNEHRPEQAARWNPDQPPAA